MIVAKIVRDLTSSGFFWFLASVALVTLIASRVLGHDELTWIWILSNFAIMGGYIYVAITVAPYFEVDRDTKIAAVVFFFTCATTHAHLGSHALVEEPISLDDFTDPHMLVVHVVQAASIWRFVTGLRRSAIIDRERFKSLMGNPQRGRRKSDETARRVEER